MLSYQKLPLLIWRVYRKSYMVQEIHLSAQHIKVKRGKSERHVIIIEGKEYQYKGGNDTNKKNSRRRLKHYI